MFKRLSDRHLDDHNVKIRKEDVQAGIDTVEAIVVTAIAAWPSYYGGVARPH